MSINLNSEKDSVEFANSGEDGKTTLSDLAEYIASGSTVSQADAVMVLENAFSKIADDIKEGKIVHIGEYFTLQTENSVTEKETEEAAIPANVKGIKAIFRPGKILRDVLGLNKASQKEDDYNFKQIYRL